MVHETREPSDIHDPEGYFYLRYVDNYLLFIETRTRSFCFLFFFFFNSFEIFFVVVVVRYICLSPVVSSTTSATAHHEDVSRLTWSRSVHYVDFFRRFSRRHDRRPTGAVRLWQCGIICGTCERRDAAPLVANLSTVCIAQARKYVFRPVHGKIRISLDHHLNVTRTIFSYKR